MGATRRDFLAAAAASLAVGVLRPARALALDDGAIFAAARNAEGVFGAVRLDRKLAAESFRDAPGRLHGVVPRPGSTEWAAVARRPGDFVLVFDERGGPLVTIEAPQGLRYAGHASFEASGRLLYVAAIDEVTGEGDVLVHDAAAAGYPLVGRFPSRGIGPHELLMVGDTLVVANGAREANSRPGIPILGTTGAPSLVVGLDPRTGEARFIHGVPEAGAPTSLRHMAAIGEGRFLVAAQSRDDPEADALFIGDGRSFAPVADASGGLAALRGYVCSLAIDGSGRFAAATSPKGGVLAAIDLAGAIAACTVPLADICGLVAGPRPRTFIATSGLGDMLLVEVGERGARIIDRRVTTLAFDNHAARR